MSVAAVVRQVAFVLQVLSAIVAVPVAAFAQGAPLRGSPGVGDAIYPLAGNGGYAVDRYDVALTWAPATGTVDGDIAIRMTVTEPLSAFNLDYSGPEIAAVTVAGHPAEWAREDRELKVDVPAGGNLRIGEAVEVRVVYRGVPSTLTHPVLGEIGWLALPDGAISASMPDAARAWLPVNGHPSDRAVFAFRLTVPEGYTAVASGTPGEVEARNGSRIFTYETADQIRPAAAFVAFGHMRATELTGPGDTLLRIWVDEALPDGVEDRLQVLGDMISDLATRFGPYPFEETTVLVVNSDLAGALDAQIAPTFSPATMDDDAVLAHAIARQWWGNAVSPESWADLWLQEGLATYAEVLWVESQQGPAAAEALLQDWAETVRHHDDTQPAEADRPAMLFERTTGQRGALAADALRRSLGDGPFFRVLQAFAERFGNDVASVQSFIAVAEELSGSQLDQWQADWLSTAVQPVQP